MELIFEWNKKKAETNIQKHGVDFSEAKTVFYNSLSKIFDDEIHTNAERREIIVGFSSKGRLLIVIFTERKHNVLRLISARVATTKERKDYEENIK